MSTFRYVSFVCALLCSPLLAHDCNALQNLSEEANLDDDLLMIADKEKKNNLRLSRQDQIPQERLKEETASYMEGYIQALIDANYYELNVLVYVNKDGVVFLYNLPKDDRIRNSIIEFVKDLPDVAQVKVADLDPEAKKRIEERQPIRQVKGVWFPESTVLFQPLIANPREPIYSIAYRYNDVLAKNQIAISLGDFFPIFRWFDVLPWHGDLQIDIAACVWADFDIAPKNHPNGEWAELITTDYILMIPLSYAVGKWSYRLRAYHISSHLGDEFMVNHIDVCRVNPSFEAIDFFTSYQATNGLRVYAGPGFVVNSDNSFPMKVFYVEYGLEWRFMGLRYHYHRLYGAPFFAADFQNWQVNDYKFDTTLQLGYEWSKLQGAGRKVRLFAEYHNGYSEGQFFKKHTQYIAARLSWGF